MRESNGDVLERRLELWLSDARYRTHATRLHVVMDSWSHAARELPVRGLHL